MNEQQRAGMATATRLTREGRLAEAAAVIRRSLGIPPGTDVPTTASPTLTQVPDPPRHQRAGEGAAALLGRLRRRAGDRSLRVPGPARQNNPIRAGIPDLLRR